MLNRLSQKQISSSSSSSSNPPNSSLSPMRIDDNLSSRLQDTTISPSTQANGQFKQSIPNFNGSPYFDIDNGGVRHDQPILSAKVINVSGYSSSSGLKSASTANSSNNGSKLKADNLNDSFEMLE
jgi:hypothetical protein